MSDTNANVRALSLENASQMRTFVEQVQRAIEEIRAQSLVDVLRSMSSETVQTANVNYRAHTHTFRMQQSILQRNVDSRLVSLLSIKLLPHTYLAEIYRNPTLARHHVEMAIENRVDSLLHTISLYKGRERNYLDSLKQWRVCFL